MTILLGPRLLGAALAGAALTLSPQARAQGLTGTYTLGKVAFQGNAQVPTADLQAALPVQPGQRIDQAGMQQDADAVAAVYQKHNVGASITTKITVLHKTRAEITYVFAEQAPIAPIVRHIGVTADSVSVTGNTKVSTADILAAPPAGVAPPPNTRAAPAQRGPAPGIKPGQVVTNPEITAAQTAIVALYKKANVGVAVNTDWTNVSPQHVAMVFKITEKTDD